MAATSLEDRALLQFDRLLKEGELLWTENSPRRIEGEPFDVSISRMPASMPYKSTNITSVRVPGVGQPPIQTPRQRTIQIHFLPRLPRQRW